MSEYDTSAPEIIGEALAAAQLLMDQILGDDGMVEELLTDKKVMAIGAGLAASAITRYFLMHPELISKAIEQIGASLEIGGEAAGGGMAELAALLGPALIGAGAVATAIPGVPPPP